MNFKFLFMLIISVGLLAGCGGANTIEEQPEANSLDSGTENLNSDELTATSEEDLDEAEVIEDSQELTLAELRQLNVRFAYDSNVLSADALSILDQHVAYLKSNKSATAKVEGNTDERGTNEYNLSLGERRAKSVFDYLVISGVDESRLEAVSYGELQPITDCHEERCWSVNRRVELNYQ